MINAKSLIFIIILLLLPSLVYAKTRFVPIQLSAISATRGYSSQEGYYSQVDVVSLRLTPFKIGFTTRFETESGADLKFGLPIGLYLPVYQHKWMSLGVESTAYLLPMKETEATDGPQVDPPRLAEFALRFDAKLALSAAAGYRHQFGDWKTTSCGFCPSDFEWQPQEIGNLQGFFAHVSWGLVWTKTQ